MGSPIPGGLPPASLVGSEGRSVGSGEVGYPPSQQQSSRATSRASGSTSCVTRRAPGLGESATDIAARFGHADAAFTLRRYVHARERLAEAPAALATLRERAREMKAKQSAH